MAESGLVKFATIALRIGQAALPAYHSKFSKRQCTQPQRLAVLCLMRYEEWTFREAEVRLAEHRELRAALGLPVVPDYTTLYRFLRRLNEAVLGQTLSAVVQQLTPQLRGQATVAVDATGPTPGAISTFFVKRVKDRHQGFTWRHWLKWPMAVEVDRRLILAQTARRGPSHDPSLRCIGTFGRGTPVLTAPTSRKDSKSIDGGVADLDFAYVYPKDWQSIAATHIHICNTTPLSNGSYPTGASICPERGSHRSPNRARSYLLRWSRVKRHRRLCSLTACDTPLAAPNHSLRRPCQGAKRLVLMA